MHRVFVLFVAVAALTASACAPGTPRNPIFPAGVSPTPLQQPPYVGLGKYEKLAEVTIKPTFGGLSYVNFIEVHQPPGLLPHADRAGFLYAYQGILSVGSRERDTRQQIEQGHAAWIDADTDHINGGTADQVWYFITLRPIADRKTPPPFASMKVLFSSDDVAQLPMDKPLVHQLGYITMDAGGRTSSHSHGGLETFYVVKGTVELALNNGTRTNVGAGQGAVIMPGVVMQLHVVGNEPVQIVTYFVTPEGAPWQNNLQTLP
jgi:quercetin dioxygenase-like cupin family protein